LKTLAKNLAWIVVLTALVWGTTIVVWNRTHRAITQEDVVLYLVALPLAVVAGFFVLRWAWRRSGEKVAAARAAAAAAGQAAPVGSGASGADASADERRWTARVLAQWVHTAAGDDAAAVWAAVRDSEVRPRPDAELLDDEGQPLFATRVDGLDVDGVRAALAEALDGGGTGPHPLNDVEPSPRLLRCLGLLAPCPEWLAAGVAVWADAQAQRLAAGRSTSAVAPMAAPTRPDPATAVALTVALCLPRRTEGSINETPAEGAPSESPDQALARAWLAPQLGAIERFDPRLHRVVVPALSSGAEVLAWADQQLLLWQRERRTGLLLLLVADSLLDEATAAHWERRGVLMSGRQPKGATLGEAAVGLLLTTPDWPAPSAHAAFELDHPPATLHRWARRLRDKPADEAGRISPEVARDTLGDALQAASVPADTVQAAVCDADLRPSRTTEWYGAMLQHMGHLDAAQDVVALGVALGDCGVAHAALCVALAAQHAATEQQVVVAATVSAPLERGAVVLQPAPPAAAQSLPLAA